MIYIYTLLEKPYIIIRLIGGRRGQVDGYGGGRGNGKSNIGLFKFVFDILDYNTYIHL